MAQAEQKGNEEVGGPGRRGTHFGFQGCGFCPLSHERDFRAALLGCHGGHAVFDHALGDGIAGQAGHVKVRDAGEPAFGPADRPAHDFDARKPLGGGEFEDLVEIEFGQDGSDESQFHVVIG